MFKDRAEAGKLLAKKLKKYENKKDSIVLAIPRGGVPVAYQIAKALSLEMDVIIIKKIGYPGNEELAIGAAGMDNYFINKEFMRDSSVPKDYIKNKVKEKQQEIKDKYDFFRAKKNKISLSGKTVIVVDDGVATGASITMALKIIKGEGAKKIVLAVPVAPPETARILEKITDEFICLEEPPYFMAISQFYEDFSQVEDDEAKKLIEELY